MLSYSICKQLKDAGFPQDRPNGLYYAEWYDGERGVQDIGCWWENGVSIDTSKKDHVLCPTLDELIAACGGLFYGVMREQAETKWEAFGWSCEEVRDHRNGQCDLDGEGKTPSEAVARLLLQLLNEKKDD